MHLSFQVHLRDRKGTLLNTISFYGLTLRENGEIASHKIREEFRARTLLISFLVKSGASVFILATQKTLNNLG